MFAYLDDILVTGQSDEELLLYLDKVYCQDSQQKYNETERRQMYIHGTRGNLSPVSH